VSVAVCELCPKRCRIPDGRAGDCRVRVNLGGKLLATTYGRPSAVHVDPIEKKPFFHYRPGTQVLSLGTAGCNLHCRNCQNWQLSQRSGEEMEELVHAEPADVAATAVENGCRSVAGTYSEPLVFYEYSSDLFAAARARGLGTALVTAAYANVEPVRRLARVTDAVTADLKSFDDRFYRENCDGRLAPVLDALAAFRAEGVWLEVSNLVIPTLTDDLGMIARMCRWIVAELGAGTPLHFLRFHPDYRLTNLPPTPAETLARARDVAGEAGLQFVYVGNLPSAAGETTLCPRCGAAVIRRSGYRVLENRLTAGRCPCGETIPGRFD
jgi:pyruvate formate lyase activating enzyme